MYDNYQENKHINVSYVNSTRQATVILCAQDLDTIT